MIAREDYVGPITKAAEAMFIRAERRARSLTPPTLVRTQEALAARIAHTRARRETSLRRLRAPS